MNYFLLGNENYKIRRRCQQLIKENVGVGNDINVITYRDSDADKVDSRQVIADCQTVPFASEFKVIIWQNPFFLFDSKSEENARLQTEVLDYLKDPNYSSILILCGYGLIDRRRKIIATLKTLCQTEILDELTPEQFRNQVHNDLSVNKIALDRRSEELLLGRLPVSLDNWYQELTKLKLYPKNLDEPAIKALIAKPLEDDLFELSNAILRKNVAASMNIYHDLTLTALSKNDPSSLIGLIAYQFRFMCKVKILADHQYSQNEIASQLGCNPYRIQMTLQNAAGLSTADLLEILKQMADLDISLKTNRLDKTTAMELFIFNLARR